MRFPYNSLAAGEEVKRHLRPHWRVLLRPLVWAVILISAVIAGAVGLPSDGWARVLLVLLIAIAVGLFTRFTTWPFIRWWTTHYVFTTNRILLRDGVFNRNQRDIPLGKLNDVATTQTLVEQIFGCGALLIGPPGERGSSRLVDIPNVRGVQVLVNELVHGSGHSRGADIPDLERKVKQLKEQSDGSPGSARS